MCYLTVERDMYSPLPSLAGGWLPLWYPVSFVLVIVEWLNKEVRNKGVRVDFQPAESKWRCL